MSARSVPYDEVAAIARRQHGLVTYHQAIDVLTRHQLAHLVATGHLGRAHRGVYRVTGSPDSWAQAAHAAVLAGGPGCVLSFRAAAHLWDLAGFWDAPDVEITVPHTRRARLHDVVVHDSQVLSGHHLGRRHGVPVTSAARTLCDLSACCSSNQVGRALDDALRRKLTSLRRVGAIFDDLATRGRRRCTLMRELLAERGSNYHPGGSDPEVHMIRAVVAAGLPGPVPQYRVELAGRTYRLDGAFPEYRIALEYEGFEFHTSRTAFDDRYERDRALRIGGWLIVYVTNRTTVRCLVADVRSALELRGWPGPPTG